MTLPFTADLVRLKNNNPGNAPDYTEHDFITLRRYNGEPLNHTQADDNLELLRRAILGIDQNTRWLFDNGVGKANADSNFIDQLFNNSYFTQKLDNYITYKTGDIINNIISHPDWNNYINQFVDQYITNEFPTFVSEYFVTEEFINNIDLTEVINNYFKQPDITVNEYLDQYLVNVVQEIDVEEIVRRIQGYVTEQITLAIQVFQSQIDGLRASLDAILALLDQLDLTANGESIDLTAIIEAINTLAENIETNAKNILELTNTVNAHSEAITAIQESINGIIDSVNAIGDAMQQLSKAMQEGFDALADWINDVVGQINDAIVQIGEQVGKNAEEIGDLWEEFGNLAQGLWNAIGNLWDAIDGFMAAVEGIEAALCEATTRIEAILALVQGLGSTSLQICNGGALENIDVATLDPLVAAIGPNAPDADLAACGGEALEKLIEEQQADDAPRANEGPGGRAAREERRRAKEREKQNREFQRQAKKGGENLRKAIDNAKNKGFNKPEIANFIHNQIDLFNFN